MNYFEQLPEIVYGKYTIKNILARVKISDLVKTTTEAYYPYTIDENDEPWMIAEDYYNDATLVWLVYLSNNIVDPYYDWYLNTEKFERFVAKKYNSLAAAQSLVLHYKEIVDGVETGRIFSKDTFTYLSTSPGSSKFGTITNFAPVYAYDYESELNDRKRVIKLLSVEYVEQVKKNLQDLMSQ